MKRKNVLVLLALAVLCVIAYYVVEGANKNPDKLPAVWPDITRSDVTALKLKGAGDPLELRKRAGTDRWDVIMGTEPVRADANAVDDLIQALSSQAVRDKIPKETMNAGDVAGFGLDKPSAEVEMTVGGKQVRIRYGKLSREGAKVWMDTGPGTDVWVVPKDAMELVMSDVATGVRDKKLFGISAYDVVRFEVEKGGVTVAELTRDLSLVWHFVQPYKGYPNPTKFERLLGQIVTADIAKWEEFGAVDLVKYGLAPKPEYVVRLTPHGENKKPEVLLVGKTISDGCYVMEEGTRTVLIADKHFYEAVSTDPVTYRDRSFTRLGNGGTSVDVEVGEQHYKVEKPASMWDVVLGDKRHPAEGARVNEVLDKLREWQTQEWHDTTKPEDVGIDGKQFVEVGRESAGKGRDEKLVFLIGKRSADGKSVYAQRKDDGGVELVDAAPLDLLLAGPNQFFRKQAFKWQPELVIGLARAAGRDPDGQKVQEFKIHRDPKAADASWKSDGGLTGQLDGDAIGKILGVLSNADNRDQALEWVPYEPDKDGDRLGFKPPRSDTLSLDVEVAAVDVSGMGPPTLYVGKRRPEGGYYARMSNNPRWAFVMPDEIVEILKKPLTKD